MQKSFNFKNQTKKKTDFTFEIVISSFRDRFTRVHVSIYHKHKLSHCLRAGQIIMVDNRRAVHGRSAFYPKYDGYDRFLIRCFAVFDLERTNYARETDDDNKSCSRMVKAYYS